jgi:hypothetical protein
MARGKHAHRKANRDVQALSDEIDSLTTELATRREQLRHAIQQAGERAELAARLRACIDERDAVAAPERARLASEIEVLTDVLDRARDVATAGDTAWRSFMDGYIAQAKGDNKSGLEAFESIMEVIGARGAVIDMHANSARRKLGAEATVRIDRARGERQAGYVMPTSTRVVDGAALAPRSLRAQYNAWMSDENGTDSTAPAAVKDLLEQWDIATAATLTPTAALAGHPHPAVDPAIDPDHPWARALGLDLDGPESASPRIEAPRVNELLTDRAYYALRDPWDGAETLLPLWRRGRDIIRETLRLPTPLHPSPRHPSPADAVALRHWYSLAAAGAWARADGTDAARGYGEAAIALSSAANFWMPPGQVHGYLDSDPISADDRDHIRMAYPNVLLELGNPIILNPQPGAAEVDTEFLEKATVDLLRSKNLSNSRTWLLNTMTRVNAVNVLDLIAARGARIEGVLLLADDQGVASGRIAWCLAVPARAGMLGRWTLPAHRDHTIYAEQIDALMAVAAWADWHEPADPAIATSSHRRSAALQRAAAGGRVHVLSAARTSSAVARARPTGRTVAAHIRRGHWRRQPVGAGRAEIRMLRVSPAIIGAANLPKSAPVYRLPTNPSPR